MGKEDPDDLILYARLAGGNVDALDALLKKYDRKLCQTLRMGTRPYGDKKDFREMLIELGNRMHPSADRPRARGEQVRAWLYRLALEVAEDWLNGDLDNGTPMS